MLDIEEIDELLDKIKDIVLEANRRRDLEQLLEKIGLQEYAQSPNQYDSYKNGKIVVIGESEIKPNVLLAVAKELGINKERFELCLDYESAQKYQYKKLQYCPSYRVVMFGPVPHSSKGKLDSSSTITEMESNDGYPRVVRLTSNNSMKITKTNFKEAVSKLLAENYI